jgi:hypothetical protein
MLGLKKKVICLGDSCVPLLPIVVFHCQPFLSLPFEGSCDRCIPTTTIPKHNVTVNKSGRTGEKPLEC